MGTGKKLALTGIVSVSMVLAFAFAFLPAKGLPGAEASSDGRVDMVDLLNMILGLDKGTTSLEGTSTSKPANGARIVIPDGGTEVNIPVSALTQGDAEQVTFVANGEFLSDDNGWNPGLDGFFSQPATDGPPFVSVVRLEGETISKGALINLLGAHRLYALALEVAEIVEGAVVAYTANQNGPVGLSDPVDVNIELGTDSDGDGIIDDPFDGLNDGDLWSATVTVTLPDGSMVTKRVVIADLNTTGVQGGTKADGDVGVPVVITDPDTGVSTQVLSPTLFDLTTADGGATALGGATSAVIIVTVSKEPLALYSAGDVEAGDVDPTAVEPGGRVPATGMPDMSQFVEITIKYTNNGDASAVEVDTLPDGQTVTLRMSGLDLANAGAIFASFSTNATNAPTTIVSDPNAEEWELRFAESVEVDADTLEADLTELSIFGPFSVLSIDEVDPPFGPLVDDPANGFNVNQTVALNGFFGRGTILTAAEAQALYRVLFGNEEANFVDGISKGVNGAVTRTTATVEAPDQAFTETTSVDVRIESIGNPTQIFAEAPNGYTYQAAPFIDMLDPPFGNVAGGEPVVITGTDFNNVTEVDFGGASATIQSSSDTMITVLTPPSPLKGAGAAGTVDVTVTAGGGVSNAVPFQYGETPEPMEINPVAGPTSGGFQVTITGQNLSDAISVSLNGCTVTSIDSNTDTQIVATAASCTAGVGDVVVIGPGGDGRIENGFGYFAGQEPVLVTIDPDSGPSEGGTTVTLRGGNLDTVTEVTFDGNTAAIVTKGMQTDSQITVVSPPANQAGPADVVATNPAGTSNALTFNYIGAVLSITSVTPDNGWAFGQVVAQIEGRGFDDGVNQPVVRFGTAIAEVLAFNNNAIAVIVPPNLGLLKGAFIEAETTVNVSVEVGDDTDTEEDAFRYVRVQEGPDGITTTAMLIDGANGVVNEPIVLDADENTAAMGANKGDGGLSLSDPNLAFLSIPSFLPPDNGGKQSTRVNGDLFGLARASLAFPPDFELDRLDALGSAAGQPLPGIYNFDIHLYQDEDIVFDKGGLNTEPGRAAFVEVDADFGQERQATLNFPTIQEILDDIPGFKGVTMLEAADIENSNVALLSLDSNLDQPTPEDVPAESVAFPTTLAESYQSTLMPDEFLSNNTDQVSRVTARLRSLTALQLRTNVVLNLDSFNITLDPTSGSRDGGTSVTISSEEGGLGDLVTRVTFDGQDASITADGPDKGVIVFGGIGSDEGFVVVTTPRGRIGTVDVAIFLRSNPAVPAVILPDAFTYTPGAPNLLLLAIAGAAIGLAAGGSSGGGGGGPCFIATAAYGTPMAAELDTLRAVRDEYLLNSAIGSAFVDTYYRISPAIADVVAQNAILATAVRVLLTPVVFASNLILAAPKVSFGLLMLTALMMVVRPRRKAAARG